MNLLLTDHLTCPKCLGGGLILLADRVEARRVYTGQLGCPSCQARYRVVDGVAEFDVVGAADHHPAPDGARLAALLGVADGPAMLLLVGPYEGAAAEIAALLDDVEIVVATQSAVVMNDVARVSVLRVGKRIPLRDGSMRGVVITGADADMIAEAVRVVGLAARVVLIHATPEAEAALRAQNVQVVAQQDDTLVSVRHS
jgi:uncharacterized protein YbaR (Trm112 family)